MSKQQSKKKVQEEETTGEYLDSPIAVEETAGEALEVRGYVPADEEPEVRGYEAYIGRFWRGNTFIHSLGRTVSGKVTEETLEAFINAVPDSVDLDNWISETDVHAEQNNREKVLTNVN